MPDHRQEQWTLITASLVILAAVALGFILWFTRSVMIPFVLAVFVVAVIAPLADFLEVRLRFKRWMTVITMLLVVMVVLAAFVTLLFYTFSEIYQTGEEYVASAFELFESVLNVATDAADADAGNGLPAGDGSPDGAAGEAAAGPAAPGESANEPPSPIVVEAAPAAEPPEAAVPTDESDARPRLFNLERFISMSRWLMGEMEDSATSITSGFLARTGGAALNVGQVLVTTIVLTLIFVLFLLAAHDPRRLQVGAYAEIERKIRRYLVTKTVISAVTGVLVALLLHLLGLQLAIVFGVLAFLLNFIPSIGSIFATLLPLPIAAAQYVLEPYQLQYELAAQGVDLANMADAPEPQWGMLLLVIALPGLVQLLIGNVLEPRIMGEGLELHPVVILLALAFWALLWGPVGAILAVPITAVARIAMTPFHSLQPITNAMAGKLPESLA